MEIFCKPNTKTLSRGCLQTDFCKSKTAFTMFFICYCSICMQRLTRNKYTVYKIDVDILKRTNMRWSMSFYKNKFKYKFHLFPTRVFYHVRWQLKTDTFYSVRNFMIYILIIPNVDVVATLVKSLQHRSDKYRDGVLN